MDRLVITFLIQIVTSFSMLGIIWFIQLIHYPLLNKIKEGLSQYEKAHLKRAAFFIGPLLAIDLVVSIFLVSFETRSILIRLATCNLIFNIFYWIWTFLFQIQHHQKLSVGFSRLSIRKLVLHNWVRTLLWTIKCTALLWMIFIHSK